MRSCDPAPRRSLRVFEIARSTNGDYGHLEVDLPVEWARRHDHVVIAFTNGAHELGWHAHVVGDAGEVLLGFPWYDHVDELLRRGPGEVFPELVDAEGWSDVEQGWWASVVAWQDRVYLAETDLGEMLTVGPTSFRLARPGLALVDGVEVAWSSVDKGAYEEAWRRARESCLTGSPSPVGEWVLRDEGGRGALRLSERPQPSSGTR